MQLWIQQLGIQLLRSGLAPARMPVLVLLSEHLSYAESALLITFAGELNVLVIEDGVKRIALVTYSGCGKGTEDDQLLVPKLQQLGIESTFAVWDDPQVDWASFDVVVLRSCWDYHLRFNEFAHWIASLEALGVRLQNPVPVVRWNADKRYLRELAARGIPVPKTHWLEDGEQAELHSILEELDWPRAVAKPTISATAHRTRVICAQDEDEILHGPLVIQEFLPEIQTGGEWSLIFFGREFSHAVRKIPQMGDFRVQKEYGGAAELALAEVSIRQQAAAVLATVEPTLYARVDGVVRGSKFVLMELELIEPDLFLGLGNGAKRFAQKIARWL